MKSLVCVLNHKSREISELVNFLQNENIPFKVFTDETEYRKSKETRWLGLTLNYLNILRYETESYWKIIIHDDITINQELFEKINYVLDFAPKSNYISFYNPTNKAYDNAFKTGRHVLVTHSNWWSQCHAVPKIVAKKFIEWVDKPENYKYVRTYAEDGLMSRYFSYNDIFIYAIVPSLIQHLGYDKSTFNIPAKVGKNLRNSATYDANFDVKKVNWKEEFQNPFLNLEKKKFDEKLQ